MVLPSMGVYDVYADGYKIYTLSGNNFLQLILENNLVYVKNFSQSFGEYNSVKFISVNGSEKNFKIKSVNPNTDVFTYEDNLEISVSQYGFLKLLNYIDLEHYVEGVMEAEIGNTSIPEFLKVQAIIIRTYALSNSQRHISEGYNLCDQVHCQAYKGTSRFNPLVPLAATGTQGKVIVDKNLQLINAAFHSNCGGHTLNSEDVWISSLPYLKAVTDTFCYNKPHAVWEKHISINDWKNYLNRLKINENKQGSNSYDTYGNERQKYYSYKGIDIPMKTLRNDWGLKSSYFSIIELQDSLMIKGKGFGHGVGLCQEGAMRMAELGYFYEDIIKFYYKGVVVTTLDVMKFFND